MYVSPSLFTNFRKPHIVYVSYLYIKIFILLQNTVKRSAFHAIADQLISSSILTNFPDATVVMYIHVS
jgi:hypothetical protein